MLGQLSESYVIRQPYETGFISIPETTGIYSV
jgi:hypothetical protein